MAGRLSMTFDAYRSLLVASIAESGSVVVRMTDRDDSVHLRLESSSTLAEITAWRNGGTSFVAADLASGTYILDASPPLSDVAGVLDATDVVLRRFGLHLDGRER